MFNIIGLLISGAIIGGLARWFYPGAVDMAWWQSIALGIAGSVLGGLISRLFNKPTDGQVFHRAGCLGSILGGVIIIYIVTNYFPHLLGH
jgi:uncharacterized membrane protein YeaQ/YmgE (transglycosylase-associated protein family)